MGQADRAAKMLSALRLHAEGKDVRTIAQLLGVSKSTAARWVQAAVTTTPARTERIEQATEQVVRNFRAETHDWVDRIRDAVAPNLAAPAAANAALRATELAARIEGLTPPPTAAADGHKVAVLLITVHPERGDVLAVQDAASSRRIYTAPQFGDEGVNSRNYDRPAIGPVMPQSALPDVPAIVVNPMVISPPTDVAFVSDYPYDDDAG